MTFRIPDVARWCFSASSRSWTSRATFVSSLVLEEARRRMAFDARFSANVLRRRILAGSPLVLERRLMAPPWLRTWHRSGSDQHFGRGSKTGFVQPQWQPQRQPRCRRRVISVGWGLSARCLVPGRHRKYSIVGFRAFLSTRRVRQRARARSAPTPTCCPSPNAKRPCPQGVHARFIRRLLASSNARVA